MQWEPQPWGEGGKVDCRETEYDGENYMGPMDVEARRADGTRKRGRAEEQRGSRARGYASTSLGDGRHGGSVQDQSDEDERSGPVPAQDPRTASHSSTSGGRFGWVVAGIAKGRGGKRRRALAQCIVNP